MTPIEKFSLQTHQGEYEKWPSKSQLYYCGENVGIKLPGYIIEKQFELPHYFLILNSWDCPFEEGCEVIVLNKKFTIVGHYSFMPFYNSFLLDGISELSQDHYKLTFNGEEFFELSLIHI